MPAAKKTIEVRKTRPKLETPFKVYIYCTLPKYPNEDFIATDYPKPQFYGGGDVEGTPATVVEGIFVSRKVGK